MFWLRETSGDWGLSFVTYLYQLGVRMLGGRVTHGSYRFTGPGRVSARLRLLPYGLG